MEECKIKMSQKIQKTVSKYRKTMTPKFFEF